jgi:menaquinone-dependent protoporphyrinogen IX oxidase
MTGKTLVAYHTKSGASATYARAIAETLVAHGIQADLVNLREKVPDVSDYGNIVVGTGVRLFMVYGRWKKILKQKSLKGKRLFMFLSSGTAIDNPDEAVEKYLRPILAKYGLNPVLLGSFPGFIPDKMADSDAHRNSVKPEKAREWAVEIATKLKEVNT